MVPTRLVLASLLLPAALLAQEKVLTEAIDHFKGAADEARKANPLLAAGTGDGVVKVIKGSVSIAPHPDDWARLTEGATVAITGFGG